EHVYVDVPLLGKLATQRSGYIRMLRERDGRINGIKVPTAAVPENYVFYLSVCVFDFFDFHVYDFNLMVSQFCGLFGREIRFSGCQHRDIIGQVIDQRSHVEGPFAVGQDSRLLPPEFVTMAIGTMDHGNPPAFPESWN